MECPNCQNDEDFILDLEGYICACCGCVPEVGVVVDDVAPTYYGDDGIPNDPGPLNRPVAARSSHYHRPYHLREQLSQWLGTGPRALQWVVDSVGRCIPSSRELNSERIKAACREIKAHKYAERWCDIRRRVLLARGQPVRMLFPSGDQLRNILADFDGVSRAFDRTLYRSGRRKTKKDDIFGRNAQPLSRHNMLNYHLVIHHLFIRRGVRRRVQAHFFFPLLKSEKVLAKLHRMWEVICKDLGWPVTPLKVLIDPTYTYDATYRIQ